MSEPIIVRVRLGSYDLVHPSEKQTQVYVQIPEVGRASWLLDSSFYAALENEPWPHVVDEAHNDYMQRGVVSDSTSEAARKAIVDWLLLSEGAECDARYDAVQAAWEADQARQHPVVGQLLAERERLRARVAELEALEPAAIQTCRVCNAGYSYGESCSACEYRALMAAEADGITRRIALAQVLREDGPATYPADSGGAQC